MNGHTHARGGRPQAPRSEPVRFAGAQGDALAGVIEWPAHGKPHAWALFAHCFTCGKNSLAAGRISRALAERGVATLRFDFTGLGDSGGEFGTAGLSADAADLVAAAHWLAATHGKPSLLLGHSLGGTAALMAAAQLPDVAAVVTMGAPASAQHILKQIKPGAGAGRPDRVSVQIAQRAFDVRPEFLATLQDWGSAQSLPKLQCALLVLHAPGDEIVGMEQAHAIYKQAGHPKSFVALDGADHLLTQPADADYVADVVGAWASRYLPSGPPGTEADGHPIDLRPGEVWVGEHDRAFWRAMRAGHHHIDADEPMEAGGGDRGPTPYDLLLMSLGACTSMTLRQYALRKAYPLHDVQVRLVHERVHAADCTPCEGREGRVELIRRELLLDGPLSQDQREDLLRIADRCPVHRTLEGQPVISTRLAFD
jgi:putative redox protein